MALTLDQQKAIALASARARADAATKPAPKPSFMDQVGDFVDKHGRSMATGGGAILGGILASPAALASAPSVIGPVAIEGAGIGGGAAIGGQIYDLATQKRQKLVEQLKNVGKDFGDMAPWAMAGPLAGKVVETASGVAGPAAQRIAAVLKAGKVAKATAAESAAATTAAKNTGAEYLGQAKTAAETTRARQGAMAAALAKRGEAAKVAAVPPKPTVGTPAHLSDIGDTLRVPAQANEAAINAQMRAADDTYRTAMEQVAQEQAAKGIGISDVPAAKALVTNSKALVEPDAATRPGVGFEPMDTAGGKLHQMAVDAFSPKQVPLSDAEAKAATAAGQTVLKGPNGNPYRVIKPDLQTADDFRRFLGKVIGGKIEGYEAINRVQAQKLYSDVSSAIDEYVAGTSAPVQANWRAGKAALEPFEKVKAGKTLVGTQKGTDVAAVPASAIPSRMTSGGRDTFEQTASVTGQAPATQALRSMVQNALADASGAPVTSAQASKLLAPGTPLADTVSRDPALAAEVRQYITQLRDAEQAGVRAEAFGKRATTAQTASDAAKADRVKLAATLRDLQAEPDLASALTKANSSVAGLAKSGRITRAQHDAYLKLSAEAEAAMNVAKSAAEKKALRDKFLGRAAAAVGLGALGVETGKIVVGGHP